MAGLWLAGCVEVAPDELPTPIPDTTLSTPILAVTSPLAAVSPMPTSTLGPPVITLPPGFTAPNAEGVTVACDKNTLRLPLAIPPGQTPGAASRLVADGDALYILADGGLYRVERAQLNASPLLLTPVMLPGQVIGGRPIQELTDLDVNAQSGKIAALDKAGHVFGYDPASSQQSLIFRVTRALEERRVDAFQFDALSFNKRGNIVLLDSSGAAVWQVVDLNNLKKLAGNEGLSASIDFAAVDDQLYTLQKSGAMRAVGQDDQLPLWRDADDRLLALAIKTSDHLGAPLVYAVDGLRRSVTGFVPGGGVVTRHVFNLPDMGLLRDVAFADQRLYALAGSELLVYPAPSADTASNSCPPPASEAAPLPNLYGFNLLQSLQAVTWPLTGAALPDAPHAYPGASRIYRLGIHNGMDFYGYPTGTLVMAVAPGVVMEAAIDYKAMSYNEFLSLTYQSEKLGMTPPDALSRFEGRTVVIYHGNSVSTVYAHLDSIAPGIAPGVQVAPGQVIGAVGVTGTSAESRPGTESPHLHFEIWLGKRYLGQGITIRETMWWLQQVFAP